MINLESVPVSVGNLVAREIGDEIILVSETESLIHTLNGVGAVIWKSIDGIKNLHNIVDSICNEFDISRDSAESDLLVFINEIKDSGLIVIK